ncbi:uncharacterized protein K444DRAFT_616429 [Hyaloscypha bicolor E]|uniref:Uncharacterized protein n=1 Tax=Hyaloscypha bicolor E TaxID=1095630 RepID=A0A2J6T0L9_9HELO|nr:uncharacterized protein K444DRAFT_616429 [Hyaloscypha bicolor E]PMD56578.1 hypothetical protein K444DRAFT_616429 [Hyaloscypha bicolor E]
MPSISQTTISPASSKKRRRDDDAAQVQVKNSSPRHALHDSLFNNAANRDDFLHLNPERNKIIPRRRLHEQKRQRIEVRDEHTHSLLPHEVTGAGLAGEKGVARPKIDLSPCHVCWRKPTDKSQLDSYAYCEGCGERTCFVCMRVCEGVGGLESRRMGIIVGDGAFSFELDNPVAVDRQDWQTCSGGSGEEGREEEGRRAWYKDMIEGHRGRICSRCCVERGAEGDVWCLGCLRTEEGMS